MIKRELKDRKWSLIAFSAGSLLMLWLYVATFRSSQASAEQLQELVKNYPKGFLEAFGISDLNPSSIEQYLNAKHFSFMWPLFAILLAVSRASGQVAGEVQSRSIGLLLAMPKSRSQILASKYAAGLIAIGIFTAVSIFGVIPLAAAYSIPTHLGVLFAAWVLCTLFMSTVYSLAFAASVSFSTTGHVVSVVSGFLLISYAAYIASLILSSLAPLKYVSLFYYFNTSKVLTSGHVPLSSLAVFLLIILTSLLYSFWRFNQRDLYV